MNACMYTTCMYACMHACMYVYGVSEEDCRHAALLLDPTCITAHVSAWILHIHVYVCICVCVYIHTHKCMKSTLRGNKTYTQTYIHTYIHTYVGKAFLALGRVEEASYHFQKAVELLEEMNPTWQQKDLLGMLRAARQVCMCVCVYVCMHAFVYVCM
jgi:hypothetical protein